MQCKISRVTFVWRYDIQCSIIPTRRNDTRLRLTVILFFFCIDLYNRISVGRFPCRHNHGYRSSLSFFLSLTHTRTHKNTHTFFPLNVLFFPASNALKVLNLHTRRTQNRRQAFKKKKKVISGSLCIASWNYLEL